MQKAFLIDGLVPSDGVVIAACHRTILSRIKLLLENEVQVRADDSVPAALHFLAEQVGVAARLLHSRHPLARLSKVQGIDTAEECVWVDLHQSLLPRLINCFRNAKPITDIDKIPKALQAFSYQLNTALRFLEMDNPADNECPFVLYDGDGEVTFEPAVAEETVSEVA